MRSMRRSTNSSGEPEGRKKLKELGPDVNADPEIPAPSGRLYRRPGERAAKQYIPVRTHNGEYLILAAQGPKDYDKLHKIGERLSDVDFHRTPMAAKKELYQAFLKNGAEDPSSAFYTKIVHLNPTDSGLAIRGSGEVESHERGEEGEERAERRPSGLARRDDAAVARGESDGERAVPLLRKQLRSYGPGASLHDPSVRRSIMSQISRLSREGADKRDLRGGSRDAYAQAFEARAINRMLEISSAAGVSASGRVEDGKLREDLAAIGEALRSYALRFRGHGRDLWAVDHVRHFAMRDLPFRLGKGQLEMAKQMLRNLPEDLEKVSKVVAGDVRGILERGGLRASGELSKGMRTGLLVAGLGAAVIGVTAIAQKVSKDQASRRA